MYDCIPFWADAPPWATHLMRRTPTPSSVQYCFARKEGSRFLTTPEGACTEVSVITEASALGLAPWEVLEERLAAPAKPVLGPGAQLDQRVKDLATLLTRMVYANEKRNRLYLAADALDVIGGMAREYLARNQLLLPEKLLDDAREAA
jgi:hypothetical protein